MARRYDKFNCYHALQYLWPLNHFQVKVINKNLWKMLQVKLPQQVVRPESVMLNEYQSLKTIINQIILTGS